MEKTSYQRSPARVKRTERKEDMMKAVKAADLVYVSNAELCIQRKKKKKKFEYFNNRKKITDKALLKRIESLVIPPAWEQVHICDKPNGHLQVTGYDTKNRKQYIYHPLWIKMRGKTKFHRLYLFGKKLPFIRRRIKQDLKQNELSEKKILAAVILIMEQTNIRIGNDLYNRLYGSYGLSTLRDKHVKLNGSKMRFVFTGKKGIAHDISIRNKRLAAIVKNCKEIPGKHLFQYYDENGEKQAIRSEDINEYIKEISGESFTSKDFRTWAGTVACVRAIKKRKTENNGMPGDKELVNIMDEVAAHLGNTRAVCKKYYIHPVIFKSLENGRLEKYFNQVTGGSKWLDTEERIVIKLLKSKKGL